MKKALLGLTSAGILMGALGGGAVKAGPLDPLSDVASASSGGSAYTGPTAVGHYQPSPVEAFLQKAYARYQEDPTVQKYVHIAAGAAGAMKVISKAEPDFLARNLTTWLGDDGAKKPTASVTGDNAENPEMLQPSGSMIKNFFKSEKVLGAAKTADYYVGNPLISFSKMGVGMVGTMGEMAVKAVGFIQMLNSTAENGKKAMQIIPEMQKGFMGVLNDTVAENQKAFAEQAKGLMDNLGGLARTAGDAVNTVKNTVNSAKE